MLTGSVPGRNNAALMAAGEVTPVIDRHHPLAEVPDAIRYSETRRARGKVIVDAP